MKVVLFCGGLGMRLREYSEDIPKPMVPIGYRPILWHVMKYYAHYGHKDFILCLGYKADVVKNYFLNYNECLSNDFVLRKGGKEVHLLHRDIDDWNITFADTGLTANIGQRLKSVEKYLDGEDEFLCNYSDGLSDLPLNDFIEDFHRQGKIASMIAVRPSYSFHVISEDETGTISGIQHLSKSGIWINGGYFMFRKGIFDYMREGEELVNEPFKRLIEARHLVTYKYEGFWASMDTFKDKQQLDEMYSRGEAPWQIWKSFA
jgi:glucose-1-phosphate cytidylyltransferase